MRKGRFGVVHGSIVQHFHPFHLQIETGNREDLSEAEISKRVSCSRGWVNPPYLWDNCALALLWFCALTRFVSPAAGREQL